jgi:hypothetical protein
VGPRRPVAPLIGHDLEDILKVQVTVAGAFPGLRLWPVGEREYRPGGAEWVLRAPGTTRIAKVTLDLGYGMTARECSILRGKMARAWAEAQRIQESKDAYIQYAAEIATWIAGVERVRDVASVIDRPGFIYAINSLLRAAGADRRAGWNAFLGP